PVDFSHGAGNFTATAADASTQVYSATVHAAPSSPKDITSFAAAGATGTINNLSIAVTVPFGTDLTTLAPTIVSTGASVSPASGSPGGVSPGGVEEHVKG